MTYQAATSPFPGRWPFAFSLKTVQTTNPESNIRLPDAFRRLSLKTLTESGGPEVMLHPKFIGTYDPARLKISKDPTNELPMETYRPAEATYVLDSHGQPVNPPVQVKPDNNPAGFLMSPPTMLTTLEAATAIAGDKPISTIRIKVAGVNGLGEASQKKIEAVAKEIQNKTGLMTDITLGSSPQPTLVQVPATTHFRALGWLEQPFIKLGAAITIFREAKLGMTGIIAVELLVAMIYVFATSLVSFMARRKEFAVLLAIGWRPSRLVRMLFTESLILGVLVVAVSCGVELLLHALHRASISASTFPWIIVVGLGVYLVGALWPAWLVRKISPYETMRAGEIASSAKRLTKTKGTLMMAFNHMAGKWSRSLLSVLAIAVPTTLLVFFLFVTFRLKGILYATWLGQFVTMQVGSAQYTAMGIALLIAVLTTAEIMWQNVAERGPEIALLKAIGWRNAAVRRLVLFEGLLSGLLAAIVGVALGTGVITVMYHQFPVKDLWFLILTGLIPTTVGVIGAWLPAQIAARVVPGQGMRGMYTTVKGKNVKL